MILKPKQVAEVLGVTVQTVAKLADAGHIPSYRLPGSAQRRMLSDDLRASWVKEPILLERLDAFLQTVPA